MLVVGPTLSSTQWKFCNRGPITALLIRVGLKTDSVGSGLFRIVSRLGLLV